MKHENLKSFGLLPLAKILIFFPLLLSVLTSCGARDKKVVMEDGMVILKGYTYIPVKVENVNDGLYYGYAVIKIDDNVMPLAAKVKSPRKGIFGIYYEVKTQLINEFSSVYSQIHVPSGPVLHEIRLYFVGNENRQKWYSCIVVNGAIDLSNKIEIDSKEPQEILSRLHREHDFNLYYDLYIRGKKREPSQYEY